ncbi:hypothetical protein [Burkholderia cepacia]|uniref:hypothetical protein n=1 Tax=Burkholderia cepacia TaxID=292 RepID=UPI0007540BF0|nr:hypothetical protein WS93_35120 [Burkholderia cepacia]
MTMRRTCTWRLLEDLDRFTDRFVATRGGSKSKPGVFQVTSTFGQTISRLVFMPYRSISALANMWETSCIRHRRQQRGTPPENPPIDRTVPISRCASGPVAGLPSQ